MPINQALYDTAKERLRPNFEPIDAMNLWDVVNHRVTDSQLPQS
jgi:hypothetical protein